MIDFRAILQQCDSDIRVGRQQHVARRLSQLRLTQVPREWRLPLAKISRRAGLYPLGLKLLAAVVHGEHGRGEAPPSAAELAEYAILLMRIGAIKEGLEMLKGMDTTQEPEALLLRAFGHFAQWDYAAAVPELEQYLKAPSLSSYSQLVGRANLAFAHVECQNHTVATKLIEEIIRQTHEEGHLQLQSNCHALWAQVHLQENDFARANKELEAARRLFPLTKIHDHFLVTKLELIVRGLEGKNPLVMEELRRLALERHDWVALREADFFSLQIHFEPARFRHLLFGSPYAAFRDRVRRDFAQHAGQLQVEQANFILGRTAAPCFDLCTGQIDGAMSTKAGSKCHQLVDALLRDFYQPPRIAGLFSTLFPSEIFDISSSPGRVRQLIKRGRQWLKEEKIPVVIEEHDGFYSLRITGNFSFRIPYERQSVDMLDVYFEKLKSSFPTIPFSNQQARRCLDLSAAGVQKILNWAIANGKLQRLGETKQASVYKLIPNQDRPYQQAA